MVLSGEPPDRLPLLREELPPPLGGDPLLLPPGIHSSMQDLHDEVSIGDLGCRIAIGIEIKYGFLNIIGRSF